MDLDKTWQVGLRPEKTKPCTFTAKWCYGFWREHKKMGRRGVFLRRKRRPTSATPWIDFCQTFHEHMVSHSRKVSIKGSNFPKDHLFRVQKGTLFVLRLRVTGNVLQRPDCFHPRVDIPQIYPSWMTFAEGCTVFQLYTSEQVRTSCSAPDINRKLQ